jgi:micrococcal nuclease
MAKKINPQIEREIKKNVSNLLKGKGGILSLLVIAVLAIFGVFVSTDDFTNDSTGNDTPLASKQHSPLKEGIWNVVHIADGDTFDVVDDSGNKHRIRLVGANTPETVKPNHPIEPFGPEASAFTKKIIAESNNRVRIGYDGDQIDKYGRTLAMVYPQMPDGEVFLNELLIREGLAKAELQYRFSKGMKERFRQAEDEAKRQRKGIWSL